MQRPGLTPCGRFVLEGVLAHAVPVAWPHVWPHLARVAQRMSRLRPGEEMPTQGEVLDSLLTGTRQLWIAWDVRRQRCVCAVVTEIRRFPEDGERVCHIWAAGGVGIRRYIGPGLELLRTWAAAQGCAKLCHGGRSGWQRIAGTTRMGDLPGYGPVYGRPVLVS